VKIACIGGGPAGLYLGILVKRQAPEHEVVVYERNRPSDTFGFGVVFSDATLGHLAAADPETHAEITARFARWDDIEIHVRGEVLRSTGHGFCGIERVQLLQILQARAKALGVDVQYEHEIKSLSEVRADVIVACDGVASWVRDALAAELQPRVDVRSNTFVWLGCTVPYKAFTFIFKETPHGLFRVHAYPYRADASTFIVECRERPSFEPSALEDIFGIKLVYNRSIWRNFPTVRCGKWHAGNVVLMGDAAHTAHFSIGSGTKLAMEDAIALRDELLSTRDVSSALAAYEARRKPEVEALQAAAQASLEWFEGTERYLDMPPVQFAYSLMTRSLRVSHASMHKRDPFLARGVEDMFGGRPSAAKFQLGDRTWPSRIVPMAQVTKTVSNIGADLWLVEGDPEEVPARIQGTKWPRWIAARSTHVGHAAQCVRAGAHLIWVSDLQLADRIRNELRVPVAVENVADPDSAIAAGRADLIVPS
jgi:anthraniloyl-CoA monooxygenase